MSKNKLGTLALAGALFVPALSSAQYATSVVAYNSGTGFAAGYTNTSAALGAPTLGASVTPFAAPYSKSQLVSIGAGGEITLQFNTPIVNNAADPYGINFILYANQFFVSSQGTVSGLYYHPATTQIEVSNDGQNWFTLNPALAPQPGEYFPTDGQGNPTIAVNPALNLNNFTNQTLPGIRALYNGSAGGTGYDLAWAVDANSNSVNLVSVDYVRIDVQSGVLDLDAAAEVPAVPETAGTFWLLAGAVGITTLGVQTQKKVVPR